jgi:hypothetical protein
MSLALLLTMMLAGCDDPTMSADAYERYVLDTLKGDPIRDTGLGQLMAITLGDLGCEGEVCTNRIRFQYLSEEVGPRRVVVADYVGKVCVREEVKPPSSHLTQHETICEALDNIFKIVDRVSLHASSAIRLSAGQTQGVGQLMNEFSSRLADERQALRQLQTTLRNINWLRPVL